MYAGGTRVQGQRHAEKPTVTRSGNAGMQAISEHTSANSQARVGWG